MNTEADTVANLSVISIFPLHSASSGQAAILITG